MEKNQKLEQERKLTNKEDIKLSLDQARTQFKLLETKQIVQQILYSKQMHFQYANRPGKCLANL